jgi:ribosome biogenesis GTPase
VSCQPNENNSRLSGRNIACDRLQFVCAFPAGTLRCRLHPRLASELAGGPLWPTTGDHVLLEEGPQQRISEVLPRKSSLIRQTSAGVAQPLAANIDHVLILQSCEAGLRPGKLLRLADSVRSGGAVPLVLLTKSDLHTDPAGLARWCGSLLPGTTVLPLSALSGEGLERLTPFLTAGTTSVLLGASGSGKSTLCNRLLGSEVQRTGTVRHRDRRGRHTTVRRRLFELPEAGSLIDTPGFREWRPWDGCANPEIETLASGCRFRNCTHTVEPGCTVLEAVRERELPQAVYRHYLKLRQESAAEQKRNSEKERRADERRFSNLCREANHWRKKRRGEE